MLRCDGQSALQKYRLDAALEFSRPADGLPAARRAVRVDRRRPDLYSRSDLQRGRGGLLYQVAARVDGIATAQGRFSRLCAFPISTWMGLRHRLVRCGRDLSVDNVPGLRRHAYPGAVLGADGKVHPVAAE